MLAQLYGPHQAGIYRKKGDGPTWPRIVEALKPDSSIHFVSAHTNPVGPLDPHIDVAMMYRDPVERALSQHYFGRRMARESGLPEKDIPPREKWPDLSIAGGNYYLRFACRVAGLPMEPADQVDGQALSIAKAVIDRGYLWIGITEIFRPSLQLLAHKLRWPDLPPSESPPHVKSGRPATADLDEHTVAWARHVTFFDQMLYERARARTEREIAALNAALSA